MSSRAKDRLLLATIGLLLCTALAALLVSSEDDIWWVEQKLAECDLAFARTAGFPARLVVLPRTTNLAATGEEMRRRSGDDDVSLLLVSRAGAWIGKSRKFAKNVSPEVEDKIISDWTGRYLVRGDLSGAVRGLTRGYLLAVREAGGLGNVALAPLPPANTAFGSPSLSINWGAPLALAIVLGQMYLARRRKSAAVPALAAERDRPKPMLGAAAAIR
jgi:hypothetical protein